MSDTTKAKKPRKTAAPAEARPLGRPSTFTQELADEICARLAKGEPLATICHDEHMPAVRTVSDWKDAHETFSADFARAREEGFDQIAADCLRIADTQELGETVTIDANGKKVTSEDMLAHRKLRIETRLKLLAKWDPKRYGDKVDVNHGGQGDNPMNWSINFVKPGDER